MGKFIAVIALAVIVSASQPALSATQLERQKDWCSTMSILAKVHMSQRQGGETKEDATFSAMSATNPGSRIREMYLDQIAGAYSKPIEPSDKGKKVAAIEFQNDWYARCMKGIPGTD